MFIAINRLKVKPGTGDQMEARFAEPKGLERTPGFIRFQLLRRVWQPHGEPDHAEYLAMTEWETREAFHAWTKSDAFKEAHSGPQLDIFVAPGEPAGYEIAVERTPDTPEAPDTAATDAAPAGKE